MKRFAAWACAAVLVAGGAFAEGEPGAEAKHDALARLAEAVALPERAPECVRWAAGEVLAAMSRQKIPGEALPRPGSIRILLHPPAGDGEISAQLAAAPESFVLARAPDGGLTVAGRDATGAMYGLLELAEQVAAAAPAATWNALFQAVAPARGSPRIAVRAENNFFHCDPNGNLAPWFYDDAFWTGYLALLARSRINVLDVHGVYAPATTVFWNMLPFFTGGNEASSRNQAMLRRIVTLAAARGVRVAMMNYQIGGKNDLGDQAARVSELVKGVPGLWMLGARIKKEGDDALDPFEKAYLRPSQGAGFGGPYSTRSWGTDLKTVQEMGKACGGKLYVEVKFNGEHLGCPYPAIQGWGEDYSYQGYLKQPRPFEVLWQVRANGTHRVFPWGDPAFVRTAVESFTLGGAQGFSLESPTAYYPPETAARYREDARGDGTYLYERQFAWRGMWGRLAYDPATSDEVLARAFVLRYGRRAGQEAFRALAAASRIVPRVYASYAVGPDHRDFAPELELGAASRDYKAGWRGLDDLAAVQPLDRARMSSPTECAQALAERAFDARVNPLETARRLEADAAEAERSADALSGALENARECAELNALAGEARALADLARSTAERLRALTYWALAAKTGDARWLGQCRAALSRAKDRWKDLAAAADAIYQPVHDPLRMGNGYTWASQLAIFDRLTGEVDKQIGKLRKKKQKADGEPELSIALPERASPEAVCEIRRKKDEITVEFRPADGRPPAGAVLACCPLDSEGAWFFKDLAWDAKARACVATIKVPPGGLLLHVQGQDEEGRPWLWPDPEKTVPFLRSR
ncbi:MAG: hypothetical protein KIS92_20665 [Planctomycetota bacterium]|nr:hypothetical protein [Planctomycetota bacterium]